MFLLRQRLTGMVGKQCSLSFYHSKLIIGHCTLIIDHCSLFPLDLFCKLLFEKKQHHGYPVNLCPQTLLTAFDLQKIQLQLPEVLNQEFQKVGYHREQERNHRPHDAQE